MKKQNSLSETNYGAILRILFHTFGLKLTYFEHMVWLFTVTRANLLRFQKHN